MCLILEGEQIPETFLFLKKDNFLRNFSNKPFGNGVDKIFLAGVRR